MAEIPLTKGLVALVDEEDVERLSLYKWSFNTYAVCHRRNRELGKSEYLYMHRVILDAPKGKFVDHINGDALDNRKSNLRLCSQAVNIQNANYTKLPQSGYRGVFYSPDNRYPEKKRVWMSRIMVGRKYVYLGYYETPEEASKVYQEAVKKHHSGRYSIIK